MIRRIMLDGYFGKTVIAASGMGISMLLAYLFHIAMVRMLPASDYGDLATLLALIVIITLPTMSVQGIVSREIAKLEKKGDSKSADRIVKSYLKKSILIGFAVSVILSIISFAMFGVSALDAAVIITLFSIPFAYGWALVVGYFQGKEKVLHLSVLMNAPMLVRILVAVVMVYAGFELVGATTSFAFGYMVFLFPIALYYGWFSASKEGVKLEIRGSFLRILSTNILMMVFLYCDLFLVRYAMGPEAAAYYNTAGITAKIPFYISNSIVFVLLPQASKLTFADSGELLKRFLKSLLFIVPFAPVVLLFGKPLLSLFYGPVYGEMAAGPFVILSLAMVTFGTANFMVNILWSQRKETVPLMISVLIIPVNLALLFVLVPGGGTTGAAMATLISSILFFFGLGGSLLYYSLKARGVRR